MADVQLVASAARRTRTRAVVKVSAVLGLVVVGLFVTSLLAGSFAISPVALLSTLAGGGEAGERFIILNLRLPRATVAVLVGIAFALAGALFQTTLGNPLASPDILGITGGASAAAVTAVLLLGLTGPMVALFAAVGSLVVAAAIYLLSWRSGLHGYRFVLIGVAFSFLVEALLGYLLTRADVRDAQDALIWLVGSLGSAHMDDAALIAIAIALLIPALTVLAPRLRMLQLGDETAAGLGVRVHGTRTAALGVAVALAALGTAVVGPVAFVAFVSAPIARRLVPEGLALLPSALVGAVVVLGSDLVGQHLVPGGLTVPVGIITGAVGAPYLLWLLARAQRSGGIA